MTPALTAQARAGRRWASSFARALSAIGMLVLAALALLSAGWTALFAAAVGLSIAVAVRTGRRRWELDPPRADACFRFGPRASRRARLAEVAGVVVVHAPGASSKGIPVTRGYEQWWLVDAAGRSLGHDSTEGLDPAEVERFRAALGVPFVPLALARLADALPSAMPWWIRHPRRTLLVAIGASIAVMLAVVAVPPYWA